MFVVCVLTVRGVSQVLACPLVVLLDVLLLDCVRHEQLAYDCLLGRMRLTIKEVPCSDLICSALGQYRAAVPSLVDGHRARPLCICSLVYHQVLHDSRSDVCR
jgi:hypothetical protein